MKERPILFSTPMVQAILSGRKTMTRRVVKPQAHHYTGDALGQPQIYPCNKNGDADPEPIQCPYGVVGNLLWVRETWRWSSSNDGYRYRADGELQNIGKWKPSIFMPRHASRIDLKITKVRVQRLQGITEEDAKKEGVENEEGSEVIFRDYQLKTLNGCMSARDSFKSLWERINGKKYPWKENPWVWVIEFKMVRP